MLEEIAIQTINGILWGAIVALIALGLSMAFGMMGIINVAHGEFFMVGAVIATYILAWTSNFWLALLIAPIICGGAGIIIERTLLRPIEGNLVSTVIVTFGISMILRQLALLFFGSAPVRVQDPIGISLTIFGQGYPVYRIFVAIIGLATVVMLHLLIKHTRLGLWVRAVRQDRDFAIALGVPVNVVFAVTFGVGTALASFAGVLASPITAVDFQMGLDILPLAFLAVIVGGMGRVGGTLAASILIGLPSLVFTKIGKKSPPLTNVEA